MTDQERQRAHVIALLAPKPGETILYIGCGTGEELEYILQHYSRVQVVGMDNWESMIQKARRRLARHVRHGRAELVLGDAGARLPFSSRSFDAVFSADLMECIPGGKQQGLLRELRRVLKPGGRVLMEHTDWDTQLWNASDRDHERRLVHAFCDWRQAWMAESDGWMGRRLLGAFRQSNLFKDLKLDTYVLTNDRYRPGSYGHARAQDLLELAKAKKGVRMAEVNRFHKDLGRHDRVGAYFYSVTRYIVSARVKGR